MPRPQVFASIVVMPIESFHQGSMFRGGPVWPRFAIQLRARHTKGHLPIPRDARPSRIDEPARTLDAGTWCGPIAYHFGHAVADFGMRLAVSGLADRERPLLFGMLPDPAPPPPAFFWDMLDHFGIDRGRVVLVREPIRVRELHVFPQAERRGRGPSGDHLDLMDQVVGGMVGSTGGRIYVSRSHLRENGRFPAGQIAGEAYIESLLAGHGVAIIHPEELTLREQMRCYQAARSIVFAEGSAVHGLQLLGRLDADVVIIARRRWTRIAAEALRPRTRSLTYIRALLGTAWGLLPSGRPDRVRGIAILASRQLLEGLASAGINLRSAWDEAAYHARRDADIAAWRAATLAYEFHPGSEAAIARALRRMRPE